MSGADGARPPAVAPRRRPEASATLDDAWRRAVASQELQRLAPAAAARAEHAWLDGDLAGTAAAARATYQLAVDRGEPWARAELAFWLWRAGEPVTAHPDDPEPYACALAGDFGGAAAAFGELGFPYDRADVLTESDDEEARLEALAILDRLGAVRSAPRTCGGGCAPTACAGSRAARGRPRGPGWPGLTPRETEVLELIVEGATNAEIARVPGDLAEDRRPPRVVGAREARRRLAARGGRRGGEARRTSRRSDVDASRVG